MCVAYEETKIGPLYNLPRLTLCKALMVERNYIYNKNGGKKKEREKEWKGGREKEREGKREFKR